MTIGDRIKKTREKCGISQTDLARMINVSKQTLYKYENNIVTNIPSNKIELLAEKLEVTESYLMGWEDKVDDIKMDFLVDLAFDEEMQTFVLEMMNMKNKDKQKFDMLKSYMQFLKVGQN